MSQALQNLVKRLFSDEKMKLEFESNPDSFLAKSELTDMEKKAVLNTHGKLGIVTSNSPQIEAALNATDDWHSPIP